MSMNCRTPRSAIHFAARWWKPRLDQAQSLISGTTLRMLLGGLDVGLEVVAARSM